MAELTADDLAEAMAGHPPIGRPGPGDPTLVPRAGGNGRRRRGTQGGDARTQPGLSGEVRPRLHLRHRPDRRVDRDAVKERIGNSLEQEREIVRAEPGRSTASACPVRRTGRLTMAAQHHRLRVHAHLDTSVVRPAEVVSSARAARAGSEADWQTLGGSATDADGRQDLPALPEGTTHRNGLIETETYLAKKTPRPSRTPRAPGTARTAGRSSPRSPSPSRWCPGALPRSAAAQPVRPYLLTEGKLTDT